MIYNIKGASEFLGVAKSTLRRWEKEGKITSERTRGGHRRYNKDILTANSLVENNKKITIGYARVSSNDQKQDLERQVILIENYCSAKGYQFDIITDLGSGLNYNKKGLNKLIEHIESKEIDRIVINYKDRLIRYGYEIIEKICNLNGVNIEIINHSEDKTYEEELVEDVLTIITVFSSRLYGSRSHKQKQLLDKVKK